MDDKRQKTVPYYMTHRAPIYFLVLSILCQITSIGVLQFALDLLPNLYVLLALHSLFSFGLARFLRLSLPWQVFNLVLAPGVVLYTTLGIPSGFAAIALGLATLMYLPTFWTRVPYFPTAKCVYAAVADELPSDRPFRFIDLGCGIGDLLAYLADARPNGQFEGVEISPLAYLLTKLKLSGRKNVSVRLRSFWSFSLTPYDVVYAFLAPGPMPALWEKVCQEMRKGTLFITNTFAVDAQATRVVSLDDSRQTQLFVHVR